MGHHLKKFGPTFLFGNFLKGGPSQPEAHVTTPKRVNESALESTPKRLRTEDDAHHDNRSTPSSSGLPERSVAASSGQKKGAHDAPSLRSSADRSANGKGLEEYRSTEHRRGFGKSTRQRRKKDKAQRLSGDHADDSLATSLKANSSARYKSRHNLVSLRKPSDDPIQDEEEELEGTNGPVARASVINGRSNVKTAVGNAVYTASRFLGLDESDDELGADQPAHDNSRSQRQAGSVSRATNGTKRPTEIEIDEELRILPPAKRRTPPSNRADMRRTTFASGAAQVGDGRGGLRVSRAVCEPTYVYSAEEGIHGASNKKCVLVSSSKGNPPFEAVDAVTRKPMANLAWLTPKTSKVTHISRARNSMAVKITKLFDTTTEFKTGKVLFLEFFNAHEAELFVSRFCSVSGLAARDMDM